jgi:hypothetical protein
MTNNRMWKYRTEIKQKKERASRTGIRCSKAEDVRLGHEREVDREGVRGERAKIVESEAWSARLCRKVHDLSWGGM